MKKDLSYYNRNYGLLTDVSKDLNILLGDSSGRTVSLRTAHGLKKSFDNSSMPDAMAEDIVHGGMILSARLLFSKNKNSVLVGLIIVLGLILLYKKGIQPSFD